MTKTVEYRSDIHTTLDAITTFHAQPEALSRLVMPPVVIRLKRDDRQSLTSGVIAFTLWLGPVPVRWVAEHDALPAGHGFIDRMREGPMAQWEHQHIFEPTADGVTLIDRITFEHKSGLRGLLTRLFFDGVPLWLMFKYRHWRTRRALEA